MFPPDFPEAKVRPSPNFGVRKGGRAPDLVVLHYTGMESGASAENWLCDPRSEVSSHYVVHEDGSIVQMVREADRAWHAGASSWHEQTDLNSASIGIEIVNPGHFLGYPDFPSIQIEAVIALCRSIMHRHGILASRIVAHSDIAPGRKIDPGEKFPWRRLAKAGVGILVVPDPETGRRVLAPGDRGRDVAVLQAGLAACGYGLPLTGVFDEPTAVVVSAFQRRFRPSSVDGIADVATVQTLAKVLAAFQAADAVT